MSSKRHWQTEKCKQNHKTQIYEFHRLNSWRYQKFLQCSSSICFYFRPLIISKVSVGCINRNHNHSGDAEHKKTAKFSDSTENFGVFCARFFLPPLPAGSMIVARDTSGGRGYCVNKFILIQCNKRIILLLN